MRPVAFAAFAIAGGLAVAACDSSADAPKRTLVEAGTSLTCPGGCPSGQRCLVGERKCVAAGLVECSPECGATMRCSPFFEKPTCVFGRCAMPSLPGPSFPGGVSKVISMAIVDEASGCDLDGDGKVDNRLARLQSIVDVNARLAAQIQGDRVTVLLQPSNGGSLADGGSDLSILFGTRAPQAARCATDSPDAVCLYTVSKLSWDPVTDADQCAPYVRFPEAQVVGKGAHVDVGPRSLAVALPIGTSTWLLQLIGARLSLDVASVAAPGPGLGRAMKGTLCAAVPQADILAAIEALPPEVLASAGGLDAARNLVGLLLAPDLDGDGDGTAESVSGALALTAAPARVVGYSP